MGERTASYRTAKYVLCSPEDLEGRAIDAIGFIIIKIAKSFAPNEGLDGGGVDGLRIGAKLNSNMMLS